jgi:hypothetical protein
MGRHSSGDDDDEVVAVSDVLVLRPPGSRPLPVPRGRHSVDGDDDDEAPPQIVLTPPQLVLVPPEQTATAAPEKPAPQKPAPEKPAPEKPAPEKPSLEKAVGGKPAASPSAKVRKESATAQDVRLIRSNPALRNRVIAAVVLPFVLLALVLLVATDIGSYFAWSWIPLITAGVTAGLLLDAAHRHVIDHPVVSTEEPGGLAHDEPVLGSAEGVEDRSDVPDAGEIATAGLAAETGVGESSGQVDES